MEIAAILILAIVIRRDISPLLAFAVILMAILHFTGVIS